MNVKLEKTASNIMKNLSLIINEEIKDKLIKNINITHVNLSNDLSIAKIYYLILNDKKNDIQLSLDKAIPFLRTKLAEKLKIRHTPELVFVYDEAVDYGIKIEEKLKELNTNESISLKDKD